MTFQPGPQDPACRAYTPAAAVHRVPVPVQPAAFVRPLDYWLNSDAARMAPAQGPSALRDMAWAYGQWQGLAGTCTGLGLTLLGGGLLSLAMLDGFPALWLCLLVAGLALLSTGVLVRRLKLPKIARVKQPPLSRAPGTLASGVGLAAFMSAALGAPLALALAGWLEQGPGPAFSFFAVLLLVVLGTVSAFAVPSYFAQHARRDFRARIDNNQALRQELEALSCSWRDTSGNRNFGPL
ncbi:hypothetical protein ACT3TS_01930 [Specibacter sp. AOP5-B1-6]|uniref:hypothetical protein n=1 Tax=Specibacter sp. AOP5-B1-6 TaxID=3457653 RepID=UPI00402B5A81